MTKTMPSVALMLPLALFAVQAIATSVDFKKLPAAELTESPAGDQRPDAVPATESVDGIFPALPPASQQRGGIQGTRYITLFSTKEAAERHSSGAVRSMIQKAAAALEAETAKNKTMPPTACFTTRQYHRGRGDAEPWRLSFEDRPSVHGAVKGSPAAQMYSNHGPVAVRSERLVVDPGAASASLKTTDAWFDPETLGTRKIVEKSMSLVRVALGPTDLHVFAARDKNGDAVHFVVYLPTAAGDRDSRARRYSSRHWQVHRGNSGGYSSCGHARVSLSAVPGSGDSGRVQLELELKTKQAPAKKASDKPASVGVGGLTLPSSGSSSSNIKEMRIRTLQVNLSVSQSASDQAPIPTVSFGWTGKERFQEVYWWVRRRFPETEPALVVSRAPTEVR